MDLFFFVILMDMVMFVMDGYMVMRELCFVGV